MAIGEHGRVGPFDVPSHGRSEARPGGVRHDLQRGGPGSVFPLLHHHHDNRFVGSSPSALPFGAMSSHEGLIGLDGTFEQLPSAVSQRGAELVEHRPSGLVAAKAEIALKLQRGDSLFVPRNEEDGQEPLLQRSLRRMKNGPGGYGGLIAARRALAQPSARDVRGVCALAARTDESVRPTHLLQVRSASAVVRKLVHEFEHRGRKLHRLSSYVMENVMKSVCQDRSRAEPIG